MHIFKHSSLSHGDMDRNGINGGIYNIVDESTNNSIEIVLIRNQDLDKVRQNLPNAEEITDKDQVSMLLSILRNTINSDEERAWFESDGKPSRKAFARIAALGTHWPLFARIIAFAWCVASLVAGLGGIVGVMIAVVVISGLFADLLHFRFK